MLFRVAEVIAELCVMAVLSEVNADEAVMWGFPFFNQTRTTSWFLWQARLHGSLCHFRGRGILFLRARGDAFGCGRCRVCFRWRLKELVSQLYSNRFLSSRTVRLQAIFGICVYRRWASDLAMRWVATFLSPIVTGQTLEIFYEDRQGDCELQESGESVGESAFNSPYSPRFLKFCDRSGGPKKLSTREPSTGKSVRFRLYQR